MTSFDDLSEDQQAASVVIDCVAAGLAALGPWDRERFWAGYRARMDKNRQQFQRASSSMPPRVQTTETALDGAIR